ncbi:MAG TPA: hypothetical protein VLI72_14135 [Methylibium sp.]|nr:hypothetical protein [Methylibium sp.]
MISREQAQQLAVQYVQGLDLRGYRYDPVEVACRDKFPDEWDVVFDVYTPSGNLMDGPVIIVVEKATGKVRDIEPS